MSSKPKAREAELNFESAMDRLEKIVEQMESGKLPLEDLIVRYDEGMNLVKVCQERLDIGGRTDSVEQACRRRRFRRV